jgi:ADP-ribose pyrophosphatase YjhB (NUDIX family)
MNWRTRLEPFTRPIFFAVSRLTRGKTLGVRGVVVDGEGRVLLVRHTYLVGWWLPGGGVDKGETTQDAVVRELREEGGVIARSAPHLVSIHSNERFFPGDHVLVFRVDAFDLTERTSSIRPPCRPTSIAAAAPAWPSFSRTCRSMRIGEAHRLPHVAGAC